MVRSIEPEYNPVPDNFVKYIIYFAVFVVALVVILAFNPIVTVPAGSRGVLLRWGAAVNTLPEGLNFKTPVIEDVKLMSVQTQVTQTDASAASKNLQDVTATIAVNYHISPDGVLWLYKNIGTDFKGRIIDPAIQEAVKSSTAGYITEDLIAKREEVRTNIFNTLTSKMKEITQGYIVVDAVNIVNFKFSADYSAAIEAKATAEQKLGEQQRQLEIIKVQAEQKIAEAQGTAQATIANAKAEAEKIKVINEQLKQSPAYVQLQYAQKWDGKLPVYWIGGGGASGSNAFSVLQIPFQSVTAAGG